MDLHSFCNKFSSRSEAKLKEDIFVGSQIREVLKDSKFEKSQLQLNFVLGNHLNGFVQTSWEIKGHPHLKW